MKIPQANGLPGIDSELFGCVLHAWHVHEAELKGFLVRRADDPNAAEDLLQEVFLRALRQGQGFCTLNNPRAWLFQVARNVLIDTARLKRPNVDLPEDLPVPASDERAPVDRLDVCVVRNLLLLEEQDRHILQCCDLDGLTVRVYAETHGLTLPAAKARLLRARQRLRAALVNHCGVRFDPSGRVCCHVKSDPY